MSIETQIDQLCDKYEDAWNAGKSPSIGKVLETIPAKHHAAILERLIPVDVELRMQAGQSVVSEDYAAFGSAAVNLATQTIEKLAPTTESPLPDDVLNQPTIIGPGNEQSPSVNLTESQILDSFHKVTRPQEASPMIGPYKILQKIAEGGMGIVFMAEQIHPVRRRVALKLIKAGMDSKDIITRFEAERQALALMDHPNIAKVLDAGTTKDGRPYFVMELVQGIPITEYCDKNKLSIEDRLELFTQTCRAIQHAHQKGIIHRDIKPSNVLVTQHDGVPSVKVIDFGLAKALQSATRLTDKTMFTEFGQVLGTFQYMSPEQAEMNALDVDTRSDVYSLGVLLYELLTGSTPIEKQRLKEMALDRILVAIREQEAPRPSTRLSSLGEQATAVSDQRKTDTRRLGLVLKGDLDWIAMKALEKDRTRRYDSPTQMSEDVQRFLCNEAIVARPPSFVYRLRKTVRKHKLLVGSIASVILLLSAGIIGVTSQMIRAKNAENSLADEVIKTKAETEKARQSETKAQREKIRAQAAEEVSKAERDAARIAKDQAESETLKARSAEAIATTERDAAAAARKRAEAEAEKARKAEAVATTEREAAAAARKTAEVEAEKARKAEADANLGRDAATTARKEAEETLARSTYFLAISRWEQHRTSEAVEILERIPEQHRHVEWRLARNEFEGSEITLHGHTGGVWDLDFSPDGQQIASGGGDGTVKLWDTSSGEELRSFNGHTSYVRSVSFSPDGRLIVSGGDKTLRLWDAQTGKEVRTFNGHSGDVEDVCFSPDGRWIASGSFDHTVKIWDAESGKEFWSFKGDNYPARTVTFSRDGRQLASGGQGSSVRLWDLQTGEEIRRLSTYAPNTVGFNANSRQIVCGNDEGVLIFWDSQSGRQLRTFAAHSEPISSVCFSPDNQRIVSGSEDKTLKLWDASTGEELQRFRGHTNFVKSVCFSPDGTRIASGSLDNTLKVWNATREGRAKTFKPNIHSASSVCFTPDASRIVAGRSDNAMVLWDAVTGDVLQTFIGHTDHVSSVSCSPDGLQLVSGSWDNTLILWDAGTGAELRTLRGHSDAVSCVCFSPDGSRIISGAADKTLKLWDAKSGELLRTFSGHEGHVSSVCFIPGSAEIVSASWDKTVRLWDSNTGEELRSFKGHTLAVASVAVNTDGSQIASGSWDKTLRIWDTATGNVVQVCEEPKVNERGVKVGPRITVVTSGIWSVCFSTDGQRVLSGGTDNTLRLWDVNTGEELRALGTPAHAVVGICVSPDGTRIASWNSDDFLQLWHIGIHEETRMLMGHKFSVSGVSFSSTGEQLRSYDSNGHDFVWNLRSGTQVRETDGNIQWAVSADNRSRDGRWMAIPLKKNVVTVDLGFKRSPVERKRRALLAQPKPRWHQEQAAIAESQNAWYAAVFHRAWLMKINPNDAEAHDALNVAAEELRKANQGTLPPLPTVVLEFLDRR